MLQPVKDVAEGAASFMSQLYWRASRTKLI